MNGGGNSNNVPPPAQQTQQKAQGPLGIFPKGNVLSWPKDLFKFIAHGIAGCFSASGDPINDVAALALTVMMSKAGVKLTRWVINKIEARFPGFKARLRAGWPKEAKAIAPAEESATEMRTLTSDAAAEANSFTPRSLSGFSTRANSAISRASTARADAEATAEADRYLQIEARPTSTVRPANQAEEIDPEEDAGDDLMSVIERDPEAAFLKGQVRLAKKQRQKPQKKTMHAAGRQVHFVDKSMAAILKARLDQRPEVVSAVYQGRTKLSPFF